eukprot:9641294-Alexandrium_andersonii.AAC.1
MATQSNHCRRPPRLTAEAQGPRGRSLRSLHRTARSKMSGNWWQTGSASRIGPLNGGTFSKQAG